MYIVSLILFIIFFLVGYMGEKRSSGAFMLVSGLILLGLCVEIYTDLALIAFLLLIVAVFIALLGTNKWLIAPNKAKKEALKKKG